MLQGFRFATQRPKAPLSAPKRPSLSISPVNSWKFYYLPFFWFFTWPQTMEDAFAKNVKRQNNKIFRNYAAKLKVRGELIVWGGNVSFEGERFRLRGIEGNLKLLSYVNHICLKQDLQMLKYILVLLYFTDANLKSRSYLEFPNLTKVIVHLDYETHICWGMITKCLELSNICRSTFLGQTLRSALRHM